MVQFSLYISVAQSLKIKTVYLIMFVRNGLGEYEGRQGGAWPPKIFSQGGPQNWDGGGWCCWPTLGWFGGWGISLYLKIVFFYIETLVGNTVNNDNYNYYVCFFVISITAGLLWPCFTMNSYRLSHLKNKLKKNIKMLGTYRNFLSIGWFHSQNYVKTFFYILCLLS